MLQKELARAVYYLHVNDIVHRDIKPGNVLVTSKETGSHVKLADFDISEKDSVLNFFANAIDFFP